MASLLIGFAISAVFSALFAPDQKGPRLDNLKLQISQYGVMIRFVFGTARIPGNVVWQTDLIEHSHTSGGKGGPKITTYTYTASYAIKLCKRKPGETQAIQQVLRAWADNQLMWDANNPAFGECPFKVYVGIETELPSPTMEAVLGVGNVPAWRDDGVVEFTDHDLSPFGNRIPNWQFEVCTNAGHRPARISTYTRSFSGSTQGGIARDPATGNTIESTYTWSAGDPSPLPLITTTRDIQGNVIGTPTNVDVPTVTGEPVFDMWACHNLPSLWFQGVQAVSIPTNAFYFDGSVIATPVGTGNVIEVYGLMLYHEDFVYAVCDQGSPSLKRYPAPGGYAGPTADLAVAIVDVNVGLSVSNDDFIYVARNGILVGQQVFRKYDLDLNLVRDWGTNLPVIPGGDIFLDAGFMVYGNLLLVVDNDHTGAHEVSLFQMEDDDTFTYIGSTPAAPGFMVPLGNGLASVGDGIVTIFPPPEPVTVGSAVATISNECDFSAYNVSQLTQLLYCYVVDQQMAGADMINPLRQGYYFDAVEQDNEVVFVNRGAPSAITIPTDDLACVAKGGTPPALLQTTRTTDDRKLPAIVYDNYINLGADYQQGTQQDQRLVTQSQLTETMNLAIGFSDQRAKQVCSVRLIEAWMERDGFVFFLPRKYAKWMPTDVVTVDDGTCIRTLRITDRDWMPSAVIKFDGVATVPQTYYQGAQGGAATGFRPPPPPAVAQATQLLLIDGPLVTDADSPNGIYGAMAGAASDNWLGGSLYKAPDGANFTQIAVSQSPDVIGVTTTALQAFLGGNVFDESSSVTVQIGPGGGTLSSFTQANVLAGSAMYLVGNEIIAAKNAPLVGTNPDTYTLSGMLRGLRGTEWAMFGHVAGEKFVALPTSTNPAALFGEIGIPVSYEAVTLAQSISSGVVQLFTNTGNALKCYSPVQLGGGTDPSGNVTINWVRRTRIGARFMAPADVPLSEAFEQYVVQIMDSTYTSVARILIVTSPTCAYSSANQVTDFGAQQKTIFFSVGQVGAEGLGQLAYGTAGGAGGSNASIIAPIPPYASPPPASGSCPLPTVNSTLPWINNTTIHSPYLTPDEYWLITFTTGASVPGLGTITMAEFGGGPIQRNGVLSTSPCGNPLTPSCEVNSVTVTFPYFMQGNPGGFYPTLAPFTTYKIAVLTSSPGAMYCQIQLPH